MEDGKGTGLRLLLATSAHDGSYWRTSFSRPLRAPAAMADGMLLYFWPNPVDRHKSGCSRSPIIEGLADEQTSSEFCNAAHNGWQ